MLNLFLLFDGGGKPLVSGHWSDSRRNRVLVVTFYKDDIPIFDLQIILGSGQSERNFRAQLAELSSMTA
jgi:hypothetical protein